MDKHLLMVSSFTAAMRGKEILKKNGIESTLLRTFNKQEGGGCGYSIYVNEQIDKAEETLKSSGIKTLRGGI